MNKLNEFYKKHLEDLSEEVKEFLKTGKYTPKKVEPTEEEIKRTNLLREKLTIKKWFEDHDYFINKIVIGEWSADDPRYVDYLAERQIKRTRFDEITQELK